MEKSYRRIIDYSLDLTQVVNLLLEYKEKGELVYFDFNGHKLYSDTVTMDSAYLEICGNTKEESDRIIEEGIIRHEKEKQERLEREKHYKELVTLSNKGEPKEITMDNVIAGLKYIAEHRDIDQEELIKALLELGCDFTFDDIEREMKLHPEESDYLYEGIKEGALSTGATIIVNTRDSEYGRLYVEDRFLDIDDEISIYGYIRTVTGDSNYTKSNIENKVKIKTK